MHIWSLIGQIVIKICLWQYVSLSRSMKTSNPTWYLCNICHSTLVHVIDSTQSVSSFASFPIRPISMRRKEQTDRKIWGFAFKEVSSKAGTDCTACFLALTGSVPCAQWFRLLLEDASVGKLHCTISQAGIPSSIRKRLWSFKSLNVSGLDRYLTTLNTFCTHMKEAKPKWS